MKAIRLAAGGWPDFPHIKFGIVQPSLFSKVFHGRDRFGETGKICSTCTTVAAGCWRWGSLCIFLPLAKMKIPACLASAFGGAALGLPAGIVLMGLFGFQVKPDDEKPPEGGNPMAAMGGGMPKMGGGPPGGGMGGPPGGAPKGGFGGGGGGKGPSPKTQLSNLVAKLGALVEKPLTISLDAEQKKAVSGLLKGLDTSEEIMDEEAQAKLDGLLKILEKDRKTLENAGYRWPGAPTGGGIGGPPANMPNPFRGGDAQANLKALMESMAK